MKSLEYIECDNCGNKIQIENAFTKELQLEFDKKLNEERHKLNNFYISKEKALELKQAEFEEKKKKENEIFKARIEKEKEQLKSDIFSRTQKEFEQKLKAQQEDILKQQEKIQELQAMEIEMQRIKREADQKEKELELRFEKKLTEQQREMELQIRKRLDEKNQFKLDEKDKQLNDLKKQIEEMKRKAEQGSMQLQGEVQELAIEEYLSSQFPFDHITEIKKGARGADCIQTVNTRTAMNCGTIYYESKRTKEFSPSWIEKFKADLRSKGADIGVLVTQAMPKDMDRLGNKKGIWICTFEEFKSLCFVLRDSLIRIHQVNKIQENKGEKMEQLYNYLTSNDFKNQIEGIVEGFMQMQSDLQKEKNAMNRIWAQREKQMQKVLQSTSNMYGSIRGLAGNAVQEVKHLELPESDEEI